MISTTIIPPPAISPEERDLIVEDDEINARSESWEILHQEAARLRFKMHRIARNAKEALENHQRWTEEAKRLEERIADIERVRDSLD